MARRCRTAAVKQGGSFKGRQFTADVILWAVRWYLMFPISYRDLELMLTDRGVEVAHTTLFRWTQTYAPEIDKRPGRTCARAMAPGGLTKPRYCRRNRRAT